MTFLQTYAIIPKDSAKQLLALQESYHDLHLNSTFTDIRKNVILYVSSKEGCMCCIY